MAKPTKSQRNERQQRIEATLKKQRSGEKRRGNLVIGLAVLIALGLIAIPVAPRILGKVELDKYADTPLTEIGAPASACRAPEEKPGSGVANHVDEGVPVTYDIAPPAYGPHWNVFNVAPAPFVDKFYEAADRPPLEALVHNLEHGYTILWYDETIADDVTALAQVKAIASKFDLDNATNADYRNKFIAAPWTDDDENGADFPDGTHIAFTHWSKSDDPKITTEDGQVADSIGIWQYCTDVSGAALAQFMQDYPYTDAPEASVI
ncbi:DUF3105 domain-containing protein [Nocardioides sp.]|uniref:DUF3105 domain-containing protein n=1 Tax=Nocardioides sp. TaxID=35761 RepID=UPI003513F72D